MTGILCIQYTYNFSNLKPNNYNKNDTRRKTTTPIQYSTRTIANYDYDDDDNNDTDNDDDNNCNNNNDNNRRIAACFDGYPVVFNIHKILPI